MRRIYSRIRRRIRLATQTGSTALLGSLLALSAPEKSESFEVLFTGGTLRFDYYHSGTATSEQISLDRIRAEGEWPGSRTRLIDDTNLGKYLFEVRDVKSDLLIYSRGFSSIYGEWETTAEAAREVWKTFHESQRFPEPRGSAVLVLSKRDNEGSFREIYSNVIDPKSRFVDRSPLRAAVEVVDLIRNGPPMYKVDLLVLGDGYTTGQIGKFERDARRLIQALFETEPMKSRHDDFNVRILAQPSQSPGISDPRSGLWANSSLGLSFNAFDTDRYVLTYLNRELRETVAQIPYDTLMILFNSRKYGGGGIFNLWATCAADTKPAPHVFVHEFGHSFGGLADEYYASQVAYENFTPPGVEPWEPNITALLDRTALKWRDLVESTTPLPTPWDQSAYDGEYQRYAERRRQLREAQAAEGEFEQLFDQVARSTGPMLAKENFAGKIGAFEGAGYEAKGLYRPAVDCIMFSRNPKEFCAVCQRALETMIDLYSRP